MPKNIILLSDGTGNSAGKVWRTNVWRIFQALDLKGSGQVAVYDDGVGTSSFLPAAILGGVFGYGLQRNVIGLYKFLCRSYAAGDSVYGFGFSRGAFTMRVLIGFVLNQGLVNYADEADLDKKAQAAYRAYRHATDYAWNLQYPWRRLRVWLDSFFYTPNQRTVPIIEFLGLWDTVAAYGLPVDEMTRGVSRWIWPLELPNKDFNPRIKKARHAIAIDDERQTFHPVLWNETPQITQPAGKKRSTFNEQLLQVWFAGVHSNVGGGYPDDSLANVSLSWIMAEAMNAGLIFKEMKNSEPDAVMSVDSAKDKDGRLYDSRSGLGGYYRYSPRKVADYYADMPAVKAAGKKAFAPLPKIHESVFGRIEVGAHLYAPVGLPEDYEVVQSGDVNVQFTPNPPKIIPVKPVVEVNKTPISEGSPSATRHAAQENVWDLIWRKRVIYFLSVFATFYLLAYPLYRDSFASEELHTRLRLVSDIIHFIGDPLPALAQRWVVAYDRDPAWFLVWVGLVAFLISAGSTLAGSINDRMRALWNTSLPKSNAPPIKVPASSPPIFTIILCAVFVFSVLYQLVYNLRDILSCLSLTRPLADSLPTLTVSEDMKLFHKGMVAYTSSPVPFVIGMFLFARLLPATAVRRLRQAWWYQGTISLFKYKLAPAASAAVILVFAIGFINHIAFNLEDSFGLYCKETINQGNPNRLTVDFDASKDEPCLSTGMFVKNGERYVLEVKRAQGNEWKFFGEVTPMGGASLSEMPFWKRSLLTLLYPFRRTLDRPWGALIFRVGSTGSEEDFLDAAPPKETDDPGQAVIDNSANSRSEGFRPKRDGELFFYINKPMIAIPGASGLLSYLFPAEGQAQIIVTPP